jgi:ribosomal protein L29
MKKIKFKELAEKTEQELQKELAALREQSRELRFKLSGQDLKNTREIAHVKTRIAQILTLLNQRKGA